MLSNNLIYAEEVTSNRTLALFVALALLFFSLCIARLYAGFTDLLAALCFGLSALFLFYSINYRTLNIRLSPEALRLTFGVFTWTVPLDNVAQCALDEIPTLKRLGGAGIHFMFVRKRYRASFNFLEHPRVVIAFKRKKGPVQDISFSTRQPEEVLRLIRSAAADNTSHMQVT